MMLLMILLLNGAISWWNCYVTGRIWSEAKHLGGSLLFIAWCSAIQAAMGFSMLFICAIAFAAAAAGVISPSEIAVVTKLWYLAVIFPALGTGLAITIEGWIAWWRDRSWAQLGTNAWNTFAMAHNIYSAVETIPDAFTSVTSFLNSDDEDSKTGIVITLAVVALAGGALLTMALVRYYAGRLPAPAPVQAIP